ncbi:hypothetical protein TRFO_14113 [Tritrichomonas foetus]|uniref:Uncharacterized protein n=1 Tax=Tritrichomonas foetus TaxID=1144522 RepID=A0A1J4L0I3_9EUKA|nr:hypothetical protein TRFO_14113 [Tritrichomonas foetus]|eukprot:OHT15365.1 hypothetical protein TRFO_14113 [Tritrichomonas foetus]
MVKDLKKGVLDALKKHYPTQTMFFKEDAMNTLFEHFPELPKQTIQNAFSQNVKSKNILMKQNNKYYIPIKPKLTSSQTIDIIKNILQIKAKTINEIENEYKKSINYESEGKNSIFRTVITILLSLKVVSASQNENSNALKYSWNEEKYNYYKKSQKWNLRIFELQKEIQLLDYKIDKLREKLSEKGIIVK